MRVAVLTVSNSSCVSPDPLLSPRAAVQSTVPYMKFARPVPWIGDWHLLQHALVTSSTCSRRYQPPIHGTAHANFVSCRILCFHLLPEARVSLLVPYYHRALHKVKTQYSARSARERFRPPLMHTESLLSPSRYLPYNFWYAFVPSCITQT